MFTLESVVRHARDVCTIAPVEGWPLGASPGQKLRMAGGGDIRLPMDPIGLDLGEPGQTSDSPFGEKEMVARAVMLTQGAFATPLELDGQAAQRPLPGGGKVRLVLNAAEVRNNAGTPVYGMGTFVHTESALRPGSSSLKYVDHRWFTDMDDFAVALTEQLMHAARSVAARHESNAYPWSKATLLLSGPKPRNDASLVRRLKFAAGLFEVMLTVEFDADARFKDLTRSIKTRPPNQLLVRDQVVSGSRFLQTFTQANPSGYADWLQPPSLSGDEGLVRDLICHLALLKEVEESKIVSSPAIDWIEAAVQIRGLVNDTPEAILLTDRALRMLDSNPYPDAARMLAHFRLLLELAQLYHADAVAGRLDDAAAALGLTIALFDNSLKLSHLVLDGAVTDLRAEPHVKVDDHVSPDRCGRIYFALDTSQRRFLVDHIGIHNYGC